MKTLYETRMLWMVTALVMFAIATAAVSAEAQTAPRNGSQLGAQEDQLKDGSDDGMQRGTGASNNDDSDDEDDEDSNDSTSGKQDRVQDPSLHDGNEDPVQDRDRIQDQTNIPEGAPTTQAQSQEQSRLHTTQDLEQYVRDQNKTRLQVSDGEGSQTQTRTEAQIAADAFVAAESLLGGSGARIREVAQEMNQATKNLATQEEALQDRSRVQLLLFGQDSDVVATMQQEMEQNQNRITELKQFMLNCEDCDQGATEVLVTQIQSMEREQNRLQDIVVDADKKVGLFGFLFGWMR